MCIVILYLYVSMMVTFYVMGQLIVFLMPLIVLPLKVERYVNDESEEKKIKFSLFPQMINQNEAVLLCPLPVIFCLSEGEPDSKEEVKNILCFYCSELVRKKL